MLMMTYVGLGTATWDTGVPYMVFWTKGYYPDRYVIPYHPNEATIRSTINHEDVADVTCWKHSKLLYTACGESSFAKFFLFGAIVFSTKRRI